MTPTQIQTKLARNADRLIKLVTQLDQLTVEQRELTGKLATATATAKAGTRRRDAATATAE